MNIESQNRIVKTLIDTDSQEVDRTIQSSSAPKAGLRLTIATSAGSISVKTNDAGEASAHIFEILPGSSSVLSIDANDHPNASKEYYITRTLRQAAAEAMAIYKKYSGEVSGDKVVPPQEYETDMARLETLGFNHLVRELETKML